MGYKAFVSMDIAIIGNGKLSAILAQGLALAGHTIFIGIKEHEHIDFDYLVDEFDNIEVMTIEDAAAFADLIIMAASPEMVREAAYLLDDVRKKVIIDVSFMSYTPAATYLNTVSAIKAITGSPFIVKCFNATGFEASCSVSARDKSDQMFLAGDNAKSKEVAKLIARDLGFLECQDFGGIDSIPLLDEMAICYHNLAAMQPKGERVPIRISRQ